MPTQPDNAAKSSQRPKWVAILTGAISLLLGIGYLVLVQLLDFRGDLQPAPVDLPGILGLPGLLG
jgi:hypothetical protein